MQEQQSNAASHTPETVHYVAWEQSEGTVGDIHYQVGLTLDRVTHRYFSIVFPTPFAVNPVFLADFQTQDGGDPANLRYTGKDSRGIQVRVSEEQSKDKELNHTTEVVGFMAITRSK
jgi:hypothetical protein